MREDDQALNGQLVRDDADDYDYRPIQRSAGPGFLSGIFRFLGKISGFESVNRWNIAKMETANKLLETRSKLVDTYIDHQDALGRLEDMPETLARRRAKRRRDEEEELLADDRRYRLAAVHEENVIRKAEIEAANLQQSLNGLGRHPVQEKDPRKEEEDRYKRKRENLRRECREYVKTRYSLQEDMNREIEAFKKRRRTPLSWEDEQEIEQIKKRYLAEMDRLD